MIVWEISLGTLITLATVLFAGAGFYWRQTYDSKIIKDDIADIKADIRILNKVVVDMAVQTQRTDNLLERLSLFERRFDKVLDYLRRGGHSVD